MTKIFTLLFLLVNVSCATIHARNMGDKEQVLYDMRETCRKSTLVKDVRVIECYLENSQMLPKSQFPDVYSNLQFCLNDKGNGRSTESTVTCMDSRMRTMISVERNINK